MRRCRAFILAAVLFFLLAGCSGAADGAGAQDQAEAEAAGLDIHKIGVATYNVKDAQIMMFKDYLDNYIKKCFSDVTFLYSDSITSGEEMMEFLAQCADHDVDGIMMFNSYDLKKEVEFCASREIYMIRPAGTFSQEEFDSVADNPYFLGQIGPGISNEYEAAAEMARALAGEGKRYMILSGGAASGNEMHRQRTIAVLDVLQKQYGAGFDQSTEQLAVTEKPLKIEEKGLELMICPGYMDIDSFREPALDALASGGYTTVLAVIPVADLMDRQDGAGIEWGTIDCFSLDNYFGFKKDRIAYVAGKYQSQIGPGFAALYNAVTGNGDAFREDGKAFSLEQGFWVAPDESTYDTMYALASGAAVNAYNYEDLYAVIKSLTPEADFEDFKKLVESYSYEDRLAERSS